MTCSHRAACRLGRVNMATTDEVDVEFVSNIKELFYAT